MVDQQAIDQALQRIGDDIVESVGVAAGIATTESANHGRLASNAHNSQVTTAATKVFQSGLNRMVQQVRDYAGARAHEYGKSLQASAEIVLKQLVAAHESRLTALEGKYPGVKKHRAKFVGDFTAALMTVRDTAVSDLTHTLHDPEDSLSWWGRNQREVLLGLINAVVAAVVSAIVAWTVAKLTPPSAP
ncbi:MAG: hypothetical protein R3D05_01375 [Dongiaceae bacterium]